jgi:enamine deaminase RidA (YjgF/YER057c/UK114 family)
MLTKAAFNDTNHWENQQLFSRGLRLSNFSEILFITGYGPAEVGGKPGEQTDQVAFPGQPAAQTQWIVQHLDDFFATIHYADDADQFYTKNDVVYFDLVVDSSISDDDQQAVLQVLMDWFKDVDPKPSTGILKKVAGLAIPGMMVEIEFILAH